MIFRWNLDRLSDSGEDVSSQAIRKAAIMASQARTAKRTTSRNAKTWQKRQTNKMQKEFQKAVHTFTVWSAVGFWMIVIYTAVMKGWIF